MLKSFILLLLILHSSLYSENAGVNEVVLEANEAPPFWSKEMPYNGIAGELVHAISEAGDINSRIIFKPLSRLIDDDENNDLGNPAFFMINQDFSEIIPIALYHVSLYYYAPNHKKRLELKSIDDLKGLKIGTIKGTLIDVHYFEQNAIMFKESYSHESLFKKLKLGRIDMVIEIELVAEQTIKKFFEKEASNFVKINLSNAASPIAIMLAEELNNSEWIANRYRIGLEKIIQDGTYQNIMKKYYIDERLPQNWFDDLKHFEELYQSEKVQ